MTRRYLAPPPKLGGLSPEEFLARHWQRVPFLARQAFPDFRSPITPDELAGLSCEEGVSARLVLERGVRGPWELREGPFDDALFEELPDAGWSLLVQEADRHVSELADLLDRFRFVPDWRIDDLMVSFAPPGGSVGAHVDSYDVFLLQAWGRRRWEWGGPRDAACIPGLELGILERFTPDERAVLEPGDMLYLPPGVAHHGVALEPCMTFSIGFLAPSASELLASVADTLLTGDAGPTRFEDAGRGRPPHPARIEGADLERVRSLLSACLDEQDLAGCFARHVTTSRRSQPLLPPAAAPDARELVQLLESGRVLRRAEGCRMAFLEENDALRLFVEGEELRLPPALLPLVEALTGRRECLEEDLSAALGSARGAELVTTLVARGALYLVDDEDS